MSGQGVGAVIGAVVGFYIGGPLHAPFAAMVFSMAGGLCDPEVGELPLSDEGESA